MRRRHPPGRGTDTQSDLLRQPDLGGGQRASDDDGRPRGTQPVGAFAGPMTADEPGPPGASGPWRTAPGEAAAAAEDGVPGSNALRFEEALEQGVVPGITGARTAPEALRGALYDGPERRKHQQEWDRWRLEERRVRPFLYAGDQRV
ncbi:MAG: hypothetical protein Q8P41_09395 [Pseudomonadota bacterium]|nr:hypothetical protein [Pseudomonadota bacterium]